MHAQCILEDANAEQFYPMCLQIPSKMLAKGVTIPLSLQSSLTQLLWRWARTSQTDRKYRFPNLCKAQPLSVPGSRNGTCYLPGVLTLT